MRAAGGEASAGSDCPWQLDSMANRPNRRIETPHSGYPTATQRQWLQDLARDAGHGNQEVSWVRPAEPSVDAEMGI